jgi:hypothetical protein
MLLISMVLFKQTHLHPNLMQIAQRQWWFDIVEALLLQINLAGSSPLQFDLGDVSPLQFDLGERSSL